MKARNASFSSRRRNGGFTLIELLLTVGVVSILSGAGFYIYKTLTKDAETSSQVNGIVDFVSKSKETFGLSGGNWVSFTPSNLIKMNRIPSQFTKDTSKVFDAFGNEVVFGSPVATQGNVSFTMRSAEECVKVTQAVAELAYTAGVGAAGSESAVMTGTTKLDVGAMATGCAIDGRVLTLAIR